MGAHIPVVNYAKPSSRGKLNTKLFKTSKTPENPILEVSFFGALHVYLVTNLIL